MSPVCLFHKVTCFRFHSFKFEKEKISSYLCFDRCYCCCCFGATYSIDNSQAKNSFSLEIIDRWLKLIIIIMYVWVCVTNFNVMFVFLIAQIQKSIHNFLWLFKRKRVVVAVILLLFSFDTHAHFEMSFFSHCVVY